MLSAEDSRASVTSRSMSWKVACKELYHLDKDVSRPLRCLFCPAEIHRGSDVNVPVSTTQLYCIPRWGGDLPSLARRLGVIAYEGIGGNPDAQIHTVQLWRLLNGSAFLKPVSSLLMCYWSAPYLSPIQPMWPWIWGLGWLTKEWNLPIPRHLRGHYAGKARDWAASGDYPLPSLPNSGELGQSRTIYCKIYKKMRLFASQWKWQICRRAPWIDHRIQIGWWLKKMMASLQKSHFLFEFSKFMVL